MRILKETVPFLRGKYEVPLHNDAVILKVEFQADQLAIWFRTEWDGNVSLEFMTKRQVELYHTGEVIWTDLPYFTTVFIPDRSYILHVFLKPSYLT